MRRCMRGSGEQSKYPRVRKQGGHHSMSTAAFRIPSTIHYGAGALDELGPATRQLGIHHALLVTDPGMVRLGVAEQAQKQLEAARTRVTLFEGVEPDPTLL